MARPANPLDKFVTYTYHFELHATSSMEKLRAISADGVNQSTPRDKPTGTLMINSRKDAHQQLTAVSWQYVTPGITNGVMMAPIFEMKLTIEEPGAAFFYEKLQRVMADNQVTSIGGLVFGLKIIFIGRTAGDQEVIYNKLPILPLQMLGLASSFDQRGGVYNLTMCSSSTAAAVQSPNDPNSSYAYTHKALSVEATRLSEALDQLRDGLNKNYNDWFENQTNKPDIRRLRFDILAEPSIDGSFQTMGQESTANGTKCRLSFDPKTQILDMIHRCIHHCPEVMKRIADSKEQFKTPLTPGAFTYTVIPRVDLLDGEALITYSIVQYEGSASTTGNDAGDTYEFNFYFSGAGQNVDVLSFDMKFENSLILFMGGQGGDDHYGNLTGRLPFVNPRHWAANVVHEDRSKQKDVQTDDQRANISGLNKNDVAVGPATPRSADSAYNSQQVQNVNNFKAAMASLNLFIAAAGDSQKTLRIRGHAGLLLASAIGPNPRDMAFGVKSGLWLKLNIYDENGRQFFYRDYYKIFSVKNSFQGGQFIQDLVVIPWPKVIPADASSPTNNVNTSVPNRPNTAAADLRRVENNLANAEPARTQQELQQLRSNANVSFTDTAGGAATGGRGIRRGQFRGDQ